MLYIGKGELIEGHISEDALIQLTDGLHNNAVGMGVLERINDETAKEVEGYLRGLYVFPLSDSLVHQIKGIVGDIMIYKLYKRRREFPDEIVKIYDRAIFRLKDIRSGKVMLEVEDGKNNNGGGVKFLLNERKFKFSAR